jgi:hypothetical protein
VNEYHDFDFTINNLPVCGHKLDSSFLIDVSCQLPNDDFIHGLNSGHQGFDQDFVLWNWTLAGDAVRMIIRD